MLTTTVRLVSCINKRAGLHTNNLKGIVPFEHIELHEGLIALIIELVTYSSCTRTLAADILILAYYACTLLFFIKPFPLLHQFDY